MTEKEEKAIERLEKLLTDEVDKITLYKTGIEDVRTVVKAIEQRINNQKIFAKEYEKISKQLNCEVKDNLEKTKLINLLKRRAIITENEQKEILKIQEKFLEKDFQDCLIIYFQKKARKENV